MQMPLNQSVRTPAEELEQHFKALGDSVDLINELVTIALPSDDDKDTIDRNVRHIEIMLAYEELANDSRSKTVFTNAIKVGKAKLA